MIRRLAASKTEIMAVLLASPQAKPGLAGRKFVLIGFPLDSEQE
jgi:hypothetical protein